MALLSRIVWPVWNAGERRLRAGPRLAMHGALIVGAYFVVFGLIAPLLGRGIGVFASLFALLMAIVVALTIACARWIDRRPIAELGIAGRPGYLVDVAFGVALGGACMGAIALFEIEMGWARYAPRYASAADAAGAVGAFGSSLTVWISVAVIEELQFRGYPLINLSEGLGAMRRRRDVAAAIAVVVTSLVFGVAHGANPGASPAAVALVGFGGILLAVGLVVQGDLAIPIGLHLGWNFFQNLFGMQVSGQTWLEDASLLRRQELGPDVATGGAFGPEAGLEGLAAMVLGIVLTLAWVGLRARRLEVHERFVRPYAERAGGARSASVGRSEVDAPAGP